MGLRGEEARSLLLARCVRGGDTVVGEVAALLAEAATTGDDLVDGAVDAAGNTALHLAVRHGHAALALLLIEHSSVRLDAENDCSSNGGGVTALHLAIAHGQHEVVEVLLRRMPVAALTSRRFGAEGETLLHFAVRVAAVTAAHPVGSPTDRVRVRHRWSWVCVALLRLGADPLAPASASGITPYDLALAAVPPNPVVLVLGYCLEQSAQQHMNDEAAGECEVDARANAPTQISATQQRWSFLARRHPECSLGHHSPAWLSDAALAALDDELEVLFA